MFAFKPMFWAYRYENKRFYAFCEHFEDVILCLPEHLFSPAFIYFKTFKYLNISRSSSIKNQALSRTKINFKYFQGLEIGLLKFKGFQDAYGPCVHNNGCSL